MPGLQSSQMATKPKDAFSRIRERERREAVSPSSPSAAVEAAAFDALLASAELLVEQVHQLFNQFFAGIEKRPPIERRKVLEQKMHEIQGVTRASPMLRFKAATLQSRFQSFSEQWDRRLRQLESARRTR